jgi:two-component system chemotaxis response regulator CheY
MEARYLTVLAECCKEVFQEMTKTEVLHVQIKRDERLKEIYAVALVVPYEDFPGNLAGNFFLGFTSESMAVLVAAAVAEHFGLPPVRHFDDTARDVLTEFMNTIVGHTITGWDKIGFRVKFSPPTAVQNVNIRERPFTSHEAYNIILDLAIDHVVFTVTFTDNQKQQVTRRVLVVDDSSVIRGILAKALIEDGFTVETAEDGQVATDTYQTFRPDLTIMDLSMPNVGGLEAMQQIRRLDQHAKFIVLTSTARRDEELIAKSLNVSSYVIKPVQIKEFVTIVKEALG